MYNINIIYYYNLTLSIIRILLFYPLNKFILNNIKYTETIEQVQILRKHHIGNLIILFDLKCLNKNIFPCRNKDNKFQRKQFKNEF